MVLNANGPQLPGTMLATLMVNLAAFTLLYVYLMATRLRVARLEAVVTERKLQTALLED